MAPTRKIALLFAGQGAQAPGMGASLYDGSPAARAVFAVGEEASPGTLETVFHGTAEELALTRNTQPAVYLTDLAAARALEALGVVVAGVAGFSVGEVAALAFAGAYSDRVGAELIAVRAELMDAAAGAGEPGGDSGSGSGGGMAALVGVTEEAARELIAAYPGTAIANYNSPVQYVISGPRSEIDAIAATARELRIRCIVLAVSGAFHSRYMTGAADAFGAEVAAREQSGQVSSPLATMPVYANVTAEPYGADVAALLGPQVAGAVRWRQTLERMVADGFTTFIEVGAGKVLTGLVRATVPEAESFTVQTYEDALATVAALTATES